MMTSRALYESTWRVPFLFETSSYHGNGNLIAVQKLLQQVGLGAAANGSWVLIVVALQSHVQSLPNCSQSGMSQQLRLASWGPLKG